MRAVFPVPIHRDEELLRAKGALRKISFPTQLNAGLQYSDTSAGENSADAPAFFGPDDGVICDIGRRDPGPRDRRAGEGFHSQSGFPALSLPSSFRTPHLKSPDSARVSAA
jgi:hypothetical protein